MKIHELRLRNFRKFEDAVFRFNTHTGITVLIGDNATGKSALLNALSIMMGTYLLDFSVGPDRGINRDEVRLQHIQLGETVSLEPQWSDGVRLTVTASFRDLTGDSRLVSGFRERKSEKGRTTRAHARAITDRGQAARRQVERGEDVLLPVFGFYGTGRLWHLKQEVRLSKPESRLAGYRDCLDPASSHKLFLNWFARHEQASFQKGKKYGVPEAVRRAVKNCISGCRQFYFDMEMQQLMVELDDGQLCSFDNLSDGYRNMLAIVADIAHRAGRLNPQLTDRAALETPGIVLIDEVDLHLHPKWQRQVLDNLRTTFPRVQFIVSTHSPFIIQSLEPGEVIDLNTDQPAEVASDTASPCPEKEFSHRSIEDIVEDVMGVSLPSRSEKLQKMYEVAEAYYRLLDEAEGASEQEKQRLQDKLDRLSAPFSDNVAYHAFLEMKRIRAGLGTTDQDDDTGPS